MFKLWNWKQNVGLHLFGFFVRRSVVGFIWNRVCLGFGIRCENLVPNTFQAGQSLCRSGNLTAEFIVHQNIIFDVNRGYCACNNNYTLLNKYWFSLHGPVNLQLYLTERCKQEVVVVCDRINKLGFGHSTGYALIFHDSICSI